MGSDVLQTLGGFAKTHPSLSILNFSIDPISHSVTLLSAADWAYRRIRKRFHSGLLHRAGGNTNRTPRFYQCSIHTLLHICHAFTLLNLIDCPVRMKHAKEAHATVELQALHVGLALSHAQKHASCLPQLRCINNECLCKHDMCSMFCFSILRTFTLVASAKGA